MSIRGRLLASERKLNVGDGQRGPCECFLAGGGAGYHLVRADGRDFYDGDEGETCTQCGGQRPVVRIGFADNSLWDLL